MCCAMLGVVGSSWKMVKLEPTTPNMSQHVATGWPNARNILDPTMLRYVALARWDRLAGALSPGQTIATRQHNISQHCWAQHVVCVWPPCCDVLRCVVGSSLKMVKLEPTTPNMSQHIATRWPNAHNMLRPIMLRYVALPCCDRLVGALRIKPLQKPCTIKTCST